MNEEKAEKCAQGLLRRRFKHFDDRTFTFVIDPWTHDHDNSECRGSSCGQPQDQASGLREAMADLEAQKKSAGYHDRLCPYCNRKLPEGERVHRGCRQVEQEEARARADDIRKTDK